MICRRFPSTLVSNRVCFEVLMFLRTIKSRLLFEQMLGRGTRVINPTNLVVVTPDAKRKDRFVIVDAVGVVAQAKSDLAQSLERKRSVTKAGRLRRCTHLVATDGAVSSK